MEFSPTCIPMALADHLRVEAARAAVEENGLNAPHPMVLAALTEINAANIAVITKKYWRTNGVRLTVGFLDTPPLPLRDKILLHMNAWNKTTNVLFTQTDDLTTAMVRIARGDGDTGGYWSYIGTDILQIAQDQATMNLQQFTMATPDSEFYRVVRHETGHTLGCPHEHMRAELIAKIDRDKAIRYFQMTQGWDADTTIQQVLTPIEQSQMLATQQPDPDSIMCYQIPGTITVDGQPILGGTDIDPVDFAFMATIYPLASNRGAAGDATAAAVPQPGIAVTPDSSIDAPSQDPSGTDHVPQAAKPGTAPEGRVQVELTTGVRLILPASATDDVVNRIFSDNPNAGNRRHPEAGHDASPISQHDGIAPPAPVPPRVQQGIVSPTTNPIFDAGVIMAALIVGHSLSRLMSGKDVSYDIQPPLNLELLKPDKRAAQLADELSTRQNNEMAIALINKALTFYPGGAYGGASGKKVVLGLCPVYDINGVARVIGGTGDLGLNDPARTNPPAPGGLSGTLYKFVTNALTGKQLGYQGKGAYTGFVQGRDTGQTGVFSTYRHVMPPNQSRWIPSNPSAYGMPGLPTMPPDPTKSDTTAYWGMMGTLKKQDYPAPIIPSDLDKGGLKQQGMYFQDTDTNYKVSPTPATVFGYTHGMIQAIYDIAMWKLDRNTKNAGTPYEIAVGTQTAKLASCIACAVFMEANKWPASATHLGHADCWAPLYPEGGSGIASPNNPQDLARASCNLAWSDYCKKCIDLGIPCIAGQIKPEYGASLIALTTFIAGKSSSDYANVVLDALTLQKGEAERLIATLKPLA